MIIKKYIKMGQLMPKFLTPNSNPNKNNSNQNHNEKYHLQYSKQCISSPYFMIDPSGQCEVYLLDMAKYHFYDEKWMSTSDGSTMMIAIYTEEEQHDYSDTLTTDEGSVVASEFNASEQNHLAEKIINRLGMSDKSVHGKIILMKYEAVDSSGTFYQINFSKCDIEDIQKLLDN